VKGGSILPTYDFVCTDCGHKFSEFVNIKDKDKVKCPKCNGTVAQRFTGFVYTRKGESGQGGCAGSCSSCSGCK